MNIVSILILIKGIKKNKILITSSNYTPLLTYLSSCFLFCCVIFFPVLDFLSMCTLGYRFYAVHVQCSSLRTGKVNGKNKKENKEGRKGNNLTGM